MLKVSVKYISLGLAPLIEAWVAAAAGGVHSAHATYIRWQVPCKSTRAQHGKFLIKWLMPRKVP